MIELSITTRNTAPPPLATPVSAGAPGGFARAFEAFTDAPRPAGPRQRDAADGKDLPADAANAADKAPVKLAPTRRNAKAITTPLPPGDAAPIAPTTAKSSSSDADDASADDSAADTDTDTDKAAPIMALMAMSVAPILVDPSSLPTLAPRDAASILVGASSPAAPVAPDPSLAATPAPVALAATPAPTGTTALPVGFELLDPGMPAKHANAPTDPTGVTAPRIEAHGDTPRFAIAAATVAADPAILAVQPSHQAFATALAAFSARALVHDDDSGDPHQPISGLAAPTATTLLQTAVQQVAAGDQAALDPRHDRGLHGMIDHIEMLRDDANARDTRIRLTPDALGTVDVALRRDGEAVHVRFSSANEATRLLLNDAQPRLAALAEARGVRIAGSSIDSGASGGGQPQPQPRTESSRPARAPRAVAATDTDIPTDQRLA
ncbi:MAG: flagellar hook-length control protein FliK [Pseudomonadota bacterium]